MHHPITVLNFSVFPIIRSGHTKKVVLVPQSCWTSCNPMNFSVHGLLQAGIQEWVKWSEVKLLSRVQLFATPWTVPYQASLSMGFPRQEHWSGLPFPSPGDLPDPGIEPRSPALQADALAIPFSRDLPNPGTKPWTPLHCRLILYRLSHQVSPQGSYLSIKHPQLMLTAAEFAAPVVVAITSWIVGFSRVNVYP